MASKPMRAAKLKKVGGSTMVAIPPYVLEALRLSADDTVGLTLQGHKLVIEPEPRKGRIGLKARLAMCDFSKPISKEEREWIDAPRVGREEI